MTPVADDLVGVAVLSDRGDALRRRCSPTSPRCAERLVASPRTRVRGAGPLRQRSARRVAGRVLLVGDAAGYVDALTGEGIALGLAQARAAVGCRRGGRPERYEPAWRRLGLAPRPADPGLLAASRRRSVRRAWCRPPAAAVGLRRRRQPAAPEAGMTTTACRRVRASRWCCSTRTAAPSARADKAQRAPRATPRCTWPSPATSSTPTAGCC